MFLKYIKFHDFRPFIGDQMIDLTIPNDRDDLNTIIILGDNTYGKSTFVLSFIWCLYGISKFHRAKDILNKKVEMSMDVGESREAWVEVGFEDRGIDYVVKRTQKFIMGTKGLTANDSRASMTYITETGETERLATYQNEINEAIESILPQQLSHFFFFEGEKNNEIDKKDLASSVKTILGLDAYDKIISHLYGNRNLSSPSSTSVMGYYLSKQNTESDSRAQQEYEKKVELEERLAEIDERQEEIATNIHNYESRSDEINDELIAAAPSKEIKKQHEHIVIEKKDRESELTKLNQKLFKYFGSDSLSLFMNSSLPKAKSRMDEMDIVDKGIKGIEAPAIHELLRRGTCLCGTDLKEGTSAYKSVQNYIEFLPPKNVGTLVSEVQDAISENEEKSANFVEEFEDIYKNIQRVKNRINELYREEKEILAEISRIGQVNTDKIEEELRNNRRRVADLREEERRLISERTKVVSGIETASNNLNLYKSSSESAKKYNLYYQYASAIYKNVCNFYETEEKNLKKRLQENVTTLFNNMYSGTREIVIDDKYNIVMTYQNREVDDTGGLRIIQYFAYIGGLVKLAGDVHNEKKAEAEETELLGEQYPLVLDAAFSHADSQHIKNISKELSNSVQQLVFALMYKDWEYAEDGLSGRIARKYELKKIDETEVKIVEVV